MSRRRHERGSGSGTTPGASIGWTRADSLALALVLGATLLALWGVVGYGFLNWDDPDALVRNPSLDEPGVVAWAFSTTHMSHYQPLSWLAWATLRHSFGTSARVHHLASLVGHLLVVGLVFRLAWVLQGRATRHPHARLLAATAAALLFGLHPLRVEVVAWASALPYVLAVALALLSLLAYLRRVDGGSGGWTGVALASYVVSLLFRPLALGLPLVLLAVALARGRQRATTLRETLPFVLVALAAAVVESGARAFVGLERLGLGARLTSALTAPFVYLGREVFPLRLSPLDVLPVEAQGSWPPALAALALLLAGAGLAFRFASRAPWAVAAAVSYLALLLPALGLAPSGLQATADRYTYLPDIVVAIAGGAGLAAAWKRWPRAATAAGLVLAAGLAYLSARQVRVWRDSVTLWTHAARLDPRNDVALYNLALALDEAGDEAGALQALRETLALVPDHGPARRQLEAIESRRLGREAAAAADAGRLDEAIGLYTRVLEATPDSMRARASRGMALVQTGRFAEATLDLQTARRLGNDEASVASALALALNEQGRSGEARAALEAGLREHPDDLGLRHNLARLLALSEDPEIHDPRRALELSLSVLETTEGRDPRVFDTLASAYAALGQPDRARTAAARGAEVAERAGDRALAEALRARAAPRTSPGR